MPRQFQSWIYLLKVYPQFLQDSGLYSQEFYNFHKLLSDTNKKTFCNAFQDFQNQFLNFPIILQVS